METISPEIRSLISRVKATGYTQREIAREAGLNYWWINSFMQGRIPNPGWMKVEKLVEFANAHEVPGDRHTDSPRGVRTEA